MTPPTLPPDPGWMGDPARGTSLGRRGHETADPHAPRRFFLQRLRLDRGGYDAGGAYWGHGAPLYWACEENAGDAELFFRAPDRASAKRYVRARYPNARFFR